MTDATLTIRNARGLHARAAAKFVQTAEKFDAELTVTKDGQSVLGTSIMGLMMLAAAKGTQFHVAATGGDAPEALGAIVALVDAGFHEEG